MFTCNVCGGNEFENYAGFIYCAECQTQSQEYHDQQYQYQATDTFVRQKTPRKQSNKKVNSCDYDPSGVWTSWEAFNYILYGMTQELMKSFSLPSEFQSLVLKLWASYLQACNAAFISRFCEALPELQFDFKHRDAKVLYGMNVDLQLRRNRKRKSIISASSNVTSSASVSTASKRSLINKKSKIIANDYQEHLSTSVLSSASINDETLESLGKSTLTVDSTVADDSSNPNILFPKFWKRIFSKKNYKKYKSLLKMEKSKTIAKTQAKKNIRSMAKNKLLSIIHLALLMIGSEIQLSDLLRLIREGHLSYAKVTHFLPKCFVFSKNDLCYIDVVSDSLMPTHLRQRKITKELAYLLKVERIATPNMALLLKRYCHELNLPEQINKLCQMIASKWIPEVIYTKSKRLFPGCEAWAMVTIIFAMKLLFGLNDKTELFLSDLAKKLNSHKKKRKNLFVFEDWQNFLEWRKTILIEFHYPTQEQLNGDALTSSKKFLQTLQKESKDEYRSQRFIPYGNYYMDENFMGSVREMISELTKHQDVNFLEFQPSLTPQSSYLEAIIENSSEKSENVGEGEPRRNFNFPKEILNRSFKKSKIYFAYNPEKYVKSLGMTSYYGLRWKLKFDRDSRKSTNSEYWILHDIKSENNNLKSFKEKVFEKTPENFQWFASECSRMLEMNVRDVYRELIELECFLIRDKTLNCVSS